VTGVLPIAIGRATRVLELLLKGGKEYVCIMHLHKPVDQKIIEKELKTFVGKITQLPPVRSAVKRQKRQREIYYLDILDINGQDILFTMGCQGGTYVRKFVHDFGKHLKIGAHMAELVRAKAGPFTDKDWCSLHDLQDAFFLYREKKDDSLLRKCLRPVEFAASHLGKVYVSDSAVDSLCHGASLNLPGVVKVTTGINVDQLVGIYTLKEELIGMGVARLMSEKMISEEKGLAVAPRKIFMDPGIYPKYQKAKPL